jgi:hypothetical protein
MKATLPGLTDPEFEQRVRTYHRQRIVRDAMRWALVVFIIAAALRHFADALNHV